MLHRRQFVARMLVEFALSVLPPISARVKEHNSLPSLSVPNHLSLAEGIAWIMFQSGQDRAKAGPPRHPAVRSIKIFERPKFSLDTPMMAIATTKLAKTVLFSHEARSASRNVKKSRSQFWSWSLRFTLFGLGALSMRISRGSTTSIPYHPLIIHFPWHYHGKIDTPHSDNQNSVHFAPRRKRMISSGIRLLQGPWLSLNSIQTCLFTFYLFKHYRMFWKHLRTHFSIHWIPIKRSCPHHNPISSTNNMLSSRARLIKDHVHVFLSHIKSRRSVKRGESEGQATRNEKLFPLARWGIKLLQTSDSLLTHPPACLVSLGWFKGKSTGNHGFFHQI